MTAQELIEFILSSEWPALRVEKQLARMLKLAVEQRDRNLWLLNGIGQVSHKSATDKDNAELDLIAEEK